MNFSPLNLRIASAATLLAATLSNVESGIVYTEIAPWYGCSYFPPNEFSVDFQGGDVLYPVDFDQDGTVECTITTISDAYGLYARPIAEGVEIFSVEYLGWNFQRNEPISKEAVEDFEDGMWRSAEDVGDLGVGLNGNGEDEEGNPVIAGRFNGPADDFVGVRFLIEGQAHYGWILVDATYDDWRTFTMYGWAYETVADTPIPAGKIPDVEQPFQIICQSLLRGPFGSWAELTAGGAESGKNYQLELSQDLSEWRAISEKKEAESQFVQFTTEAVPASGTVYLRIVEVE